MKRSVAQGKQSKALTKTLTLHGLPASPGKYAGVACAPAVLSETPASIDVLVIPTAGIEWFSLIVISQAVVSEVGGRTSHAATICRELGKPCVTGVNDLLRHVSPGMTIGLDGDTGIVELVLK